MITNDLKQEFLDFAKDCRNNHIPVVREKTSKLVCDVVEKLQPARILELGTAVGYSGTLMLLSSTHSNLLTVELNDELCKKAEQTFQRYNVFDRVKIVNDDILCFLEKYCKTHFEKEYQKILSNDEYQAEITYQKEVKVFDVFEECFDVFLNNIENQEKTNNGDENKFDFIFLDGPKGQYLKYMPYLKVLINDGGVIFCDDVLYFGMIQDDSKVIHKKITIVRNLRKFLHLAQNDNQFDSKLFDLEDGVLIMRKK